jgi:hypothetical protein
MTVVFPQPVCGSDTSDSFLIPTKWKSCNFVPYIYVMHTLSNVSMTIGTISKYVSSNFGIFLFQDKDTAAYIFHMKCKNFSYYQAV